MYKIIQLLIYTFTNRLTKSVHITFNQGRPDMETIKKISDKLESIHKCKVSLLFTDNDKPTSFDWFYIKK